MHLICKYKDRISDAEKHSDKKIAYTTYSHYAKILSATCFAYSRVARSTHVRKIDESNGFLRRFLYSHESQYFSTRYQNREKKARKGRCLRAKPQATSIRFRITPIFVSVNAAAFDHILSKH